MRKLILFLTLMSSASAISAETEVTGFFPFFLTNMKDYGRLRETISQSALCVDKKSTLLQSIGDTPSRRRLPKLRFKNGIFVFSDKGRVTRLDPINPKQGLFKVNGKMVLLDAEKWQTSETAMEKMLNPWIGNLSGELRAEYKNHNAERGADINSTDRKPAQH